MTIVIIGGTGMLLPAAKELSEQGLEVAVVARHASDVVRTAATELIIPIDADWSEPEKYLDTVRSAMRLFAFEGVGVLGGDSACRGRVGVEVFR